MGPGLKPRDPCGGRPTSGEAAHVDRHDAVLPAPCRVGVRERELVVAKHVTLHGGVCGALLGRRTMAHDPVHETVARLAHVLLGQVMRPDGVASRTGTSLLGHLLDELEADGGIFLGAADLFHDLGHGQIVGGEPFIARAGSADLLLGRSRQR